MNFSYTLLLMDVFKNRVVLLLVFGFLFAGGISAQEKISIQVKTFDTQLKPYKNIELSVNGKDFIAMGAKGTAFMEIRDTDLPVKTVRVKDENLEAASWNYSKGTLEVIIRTKGYRMSTVSIRGADQKAIPALRVSFRGKTAQAFTTNSQGRIEIPIGLDEKLTAEQFAVPGYTIGGLTSTSGENILIVSAIADEVPKPAQQEPSKITSKEYFRNFDMSQLDSIQSLTAFYAVFKNNQIANLSPDDKKKVDAKFNALVAALEDSLQGTRIPAFIGKISDSSVVIDDVRNLLAQARMEKEMMTTQRTDFDAKLKLINEKLAGGVSKLDATTRTQLVNDITLLEQLLLENENHFFKNQNDYRNLIDALKEKFLDIEVLEGKLSASEEQRLRDQRQFRERLALISGIGILLIVLIVLLITFSARQRRQKKALVVANAEVKRMNENLENIVSERTKALEEANRELDTFLYRASHDMRSPVCSIIGLCNIASLLSQGEPKELIQRVVNTTEGMDKLLKKLSIISEINQPTNLSVIDLRAMVEDVCAGFQGMAGHHQIALDLKCPAQVTLHSYPGLVETVLQNLIENALFFSTLQSERKRRVSVTVKSLDGAIGIEVEDNGVGIDRAIRRRVYDMFFKGTEKSKGHGLGLYIVSKAVQTIEGSIEMDSDPGVRTVFRVRLPLVLIENTPSTLHADEFALEESS
jgi:signal transduction histidine kinase